MGRQQQNKTDQKNPNEYIQEKLIQDTHVWWEREKWKAEILN